MHMIDFLDEKDPNFTLGFKNLKPLLELVLSKLYYPLSMKLDGIGH